MVLNTPPGVTSPDGDAREPDVDPDRREDVDAPRPGDWRGSAGLNADGDIIIAGDEGEILTADED